MAAFRQAISVFVDNELSPEAMSAKLIQTAHDAQEQAIAAGQASPVFDTFVDGQAANDDSAARQSILYRYNYLAPAVLYAIGFARLRSPMRSGAYRSAFMVAINGRPISADSVVADSIPYDAELYLYNPLPYSRKIDNQFVGPKRWPCSVPPGLFSDTASATRRRFSGVVSAKFVRNIVIPGQWIRTRGDPPGQTVECPAVLLSSSV